MFNAQKFENFPKSNIGLFLAPVIIRPGLGRALTSFGPMPVTALSSTMKIKCGDSILVEESLSTLEVCTSSPITTFVNSFVKNCKMHLTKKREREKENKRDRRKILENTSCCLRLELHDSQSYAR